MITEDEFNWKLPPLTKIESIPDHSILKYVGGVDLSFSKNDSSVACATLVVLDLTTLQVVHEVSSIIKLDIPYVAGFLAFREAPALLELLQTTKKSALSYYPQVLMVDGNGLLHPRGFGLACHLGVSMNLPTIGVGKNLHHVDGLTLSKVTSMFENSSKDVLTLIGDSGTTLGAAMRSSEGSLKPIFVSIGHCISLLTAVEIVRLCCRYRIPEPVRQADIRSKVCLRKHGLS